MAKALINQGRGLQRTRGPSGDGRAPVEVETTVGETDEVVTFVVKRIDDRLVRTSLSQ